MKQLILFLALALSAVVSVAQTVPVLIYHRIIDVQPPSPTAISESVFKQHLDMIQQEGWTTVTIRQLSSWMSGGPALPPKAIVLTFDDGFKEHLWAAKELQRRGMVGSFYVMSGTFTYGDYLSKEETLQLSRVPGMEVGAHSHTHFMEWEGKMDAADSRLMLGEIVMSKVIIEEVISQKVDSFAWPFGYVRKELQPLLRSAGFSSLLNVDAKTVNSQDISPLEIQRLNIDGRCGAQDVKYMIETKLFKECDHASSSKVVQEAVRAN